MELASLLLSTTLALELRNAPQQFEEHDCLIDNLLHEARGEPLIGQLAVLEVVYTRAARSDYPNTICGVVYQSYQFSWTNPNALIGSPTEAEVLESARLVYSYLYSDGLPSTSVKGATHYLNPDKLDKLPEWYYRFEKLGRIGNHEFLRKPDIPGLEIANDIIYLD